jgi:hypothetical protein
MSRNVDCGAAETVLLRERDEVVECSRMADWKAKRQERGRDIQGLG